MKNADLTLCLSGGGFRAALFHLGALRRLNELGILSQVDAVSAVSGGSMLASHLAKHIVAGERDHIPWPRPARQWAGFDAMAREFHAKVAKHLPIATLLSYDEVFFRKLPKGFKKWVGDMRLSDLPERPTFIFNATELRRGHVWSFTKATIGNEHFGYSTSHQEMSVVEAVAASACFPAFDQLRARVRSADFSGGREKDRPTECEILFTDGGVFDNLGLEAVASSRIILVSDGGRNAQASGMTNDTRLLLTTPSSMNAPAGSQWEALRWILSGESRNPDVHKGRLLLLQRRLMTKEVDGAYWSIGDGSETRQAGVTLGYSQALAEELIASVRTQLDAFSEAERQVLDNHGYLVADGQVRVYAPQLITIDAALAVPWPKALSEHFVRKALRHSHNISSGARALKRLLS